MKMICINKIGGKRGVGNNNEFYQVKELKIKRIISKIRSV